MLNLLKTMTIFFTMTFALLASPSMAQGRRPWLATHHFPHGSQKGHDEWVVNNTKKSASPFFVDLAACRPECLSNSMMLERKYGWKGLCIEANGYLAKLLRAERSCTVIEVPIAETTREISFYLRDATGGIVSKGMDNEDVKAERIKQKEKETNQGHLEVITTQRLDAVLRSADAPNVIDYLSLDVEGAEDDVLCDDFPFSEFTFLLVTIEQPPPSLNRRLFNNGYLFVKNHVHGTFYVHASHPQATDLSYNETFVQVAAKCTKSRQKRFESDNECMWEEELRRELRYEDTQIHASPFFTLNAIQPRFVFFAGLAGTGHHFWSSALDNCAVCGEALNVRKGLTQNWFANDSTQQSHKNIKKVERISSLLAADPIQASKPLQFINVYHHQGPNPELSYPSGKMENPDLNLLVRAAHAARVELNVVIMLRDPAVLERSVNRRFHTLFASTWHGTTPEADALLASARALYTQLTSLRNASIPIRMVCISYEELPNASSVLDDILCDSNACGTWSFKDVATAKFKQSNSTLTKDAPPHLKALYDLNDQLHQICNDHHAKGGVVNNWRVPSRPTEPLP